MNCLDEIHLVILFSPTNQAARHDNPTPTISPILFTGGPPAQQLGQVS